MKVFKFGGASVKDAEAVQNICRILEQFKGEQLMVVVSAMGKTTNAMERIVNAYFNEEDYRPMLQERKQFHFDIIKELFPEQQAVYQIVNLQFGKLEQKLSNPPSDYFDFEYDQVVSYGEIISTLIISEYLNFKNMQACWMDARKLIRTDNTYRDARINWEKTTELVQHYLKPQLEQNDVVISQGFIGHTPERFTTTLGREGSDFSAAIFAHSGGAESVTIWKDVPGVLNADPKYFDNTVKLDKISFQEAIELSYYGATIIHPKTIKPLENKNITLYVRSFKNPESEGTMIQKNMDADNLVPSFIFKVHQVLISITPRDFSFVAEDHLSDIFDRIAKAAVRINMMQNSAINFSVCVDWDERKVPELIESLKDEYTVQYNDNLELVTIRHFDEATIERVTGNKEIFVDQRTRNTARMVMR